MNVFLQNPISLRFKVDGEFLKRYPFVKTPTDYDCFHSSLNENLLTIGIDAISKPGILDGPNGVLKFLSERDGSFAGSIPHDVVWEFVKVLAKVWKSSASVVRKFGDDIYVNTVFAYGGKTWWTRLTNRFCYKVAFPFGNFLKNHGLKLPHYTAPLIVIVLLPIALWMFLFNRGYCRLTLVDPPEIDLEIDSGDKKTKRLVLKPAIQAMC